MQIIALSSTPINAFVLPQTVNDNKTNIAAEDQDGKKRIVAVGWNNKVKEFEVYIGR